MQRTWNLAAMAMLVLALASLPAVAQYGGTTPDSTMPEGDTTTTGIPAGGMDLGLLVLALVVAAVIALAVVALMPRRPVSPPP